MHTNARKNHNTLMCFAFLFLGLVGADCPAWAGRNQDPFLPFWQAAPQTFQDTVTLPNIRPHQLKLLGLAWSEPKKTDLCILVELPDGKSALLGPQSLIGPYRGAITEIRDQSIVIVELCPDILGQPEKKLTVLTLTREESHE